MEILGQPALWQNIYDDIIHNESLRIFFSDLENLEDYDIILTGAGSSAFIGDVLESAFIKYLSRYTRAVPTTTIVTHPELYLQKDKPTLMVSFARSGESPESVASMILANEVCDDIRHVVVTCNPNGKLVAYGNEIIQNHLKNFREISECDFSRCIFLGSEALLGIARESHLKVQELTNGEVMCNFYSYLGLRHGSKVVIDDTTLVVFLISNNKYVQQYEQDLIHGLVHESLGKMKVGVSDHCGSRLGVDFHLNLSSGDLPLDIYLYALVSTLPAQIIGFYKSMKLGSSPDTPSENGTISRVVKGFDIYEYNSKSP